MKDLFVECNDMGLSEKEFKQTFCDVCRNRECVRADWAFSSWDKRILTQADRMLINPNIVSQTESSRWEGISNLETLENSGVVEVWNFDQTPQEAPKQVEIISTVEEVAEVEQKPTVVKSEPEQRVSSFNTPAKSITIGGNIESKPKNDPWAVPAKNNLKVGGTFKMGE
jgi:hypothetical protein